MFSFFYPFRTTSQLHHTNRRSGELYYKENLLNLDKTPRQYLSEFPELLGYLPLLVRFGFADIPLRKTCEANGLSVIQNLIDCATR